MRPALKVVMLNDGDFVDVTCCTFHIYRSTQFCVSFFMGVNLRLS